MPTSHPWTKQSPPCLPPYPASTRRRGETYEGERRNTPGSPANEIASSSGRFVRIGRFLAMTRGTGTGAERQGWKQKLRDEVGSRSGKSPSGNRATPGRFLAMTAAGLHQGRLPPQWSRGTVTLPREGRRPRRPFQLWHQNKKPSNKSRLDRQYSLTQQAQIHTTDF